LLAAHERAQALVLLATGGAAVQVGPQARDHGVGVAAGELQLDVAVELREALVAADLRSRRAEQPTQRPLQIRPFGQPRPAGRELTRAEVLHEVALLSR
jgi:hypothetical protein